MRDKNVNFEKIHPNSILPYTKSVREYTHTFARIPLKKAQLSRSHSKKSTSQYPETKFGVQRERTRMHPHRETLAPTGAAPDPIFQTRRTRARRREAAAPAAAAERRLPTHSHTLTHARDALDRSAYTALHLIRSLPFSLSLSFFLRYMQSASERER